MFSYNYGPGELIFMWPVLGVAYNVNTDWRGWQDQEARSDITFQKSPSGLIGGEPQRSRDKKKKRRSLLSEIQERLSWLFNQKFKR